MVVTQTSLAAQAARVVAQRHPRRVLAALGFVLLGTGATAFAVATLVPDKKNVAKRRKASKIWIRPSEL